MKLYRKRLPYKYHVYGFYIKSHWPLPCPEQKSSGLPKIRFVEGPASSFEEAYLKTKAEKNAKEFFHYIHLQDGSTYIRWSRLFEFLISSTGHSIIGQSLNNSTTEAFLSYLLGPTLSFAIIRQGIEPLHSTVIIVNEGAVGFIGDCGYGKSSLGASFLQAGYTLLTDDLLVLKEDNGSLLASPGLPRIKLFSKIAKKVIGKKVKGVPMNHLTSKLIFPLNRHQFNSTAMPLRVIYALTPPTASLRPREVTIRKLSQRGAFLSLLKNTFNAEVTKPARLKGQFNFFSQVASRVPIKSLSYPRTLKSLPLVREAVLEDLKKL